MRAQALLALSSLYLAPSALARATPRDACPAVAPAAAAAADSLKADIRADTNRDGDVDLTGSSDSEGKTQWTADSGAIFLPNIGDTDKRCSNALLRGPAVPNDRLDKCNDASDNTLRSEQYLAPLRTVPMSALPDDATGRVTVKDTKQRDNVRIFYQAAVNGTWAYVDDKTTFNAAALRKGLVLGIDGRDTRRPGGWDGRVTVTFDVKSSKGSSSDNVMLRVAPVLTHTHLDTVEQVIGVKANETAAPWLVRFNDELSKAVNATGIEEPVYQFSGSDDVWAQDFMEPGFASMPGPDGPVTLRIMIRSPQDERVAGRQLFEYYRDTGIGAVQQLGGARDEINSGGNIETIPPYKFNGTSWPAGRIILGDHGEKKHHLTPFFEAQETQQPLHLDTDWLSIGHVDEFLQFVPADSERGWVLMADDPMEAVKMLQKLKDGGYGSQVAYSRKNDTQQSNNTCQDLGCNAIPVPGTTINEMLANKDLMDLQKRCAERIENNLRILKEATGLADDEIIRLPAMFKYSQVGSFIGNGPPNGGPNGPANGNSTDDSAFNGPPPSDNSTDGSVPNGAPFNGPPPIGAPSGNGTAPFKVGALFPGVVNGVVLTGYDTYIAPNPWGPVINGTDVLAQRIKEQYAKVNMTIVYIDDWNTHHNLGGEIHCGTNTAREMDIEWY